MSTPNTPVELKIAARLFILMSIIALLIIGKELFITLMIAIFFTFLLLPISQFLIRYKIPKPIAIIISILIAIIFFGGLVWFFIGQLNSFGEDLPHLKEQVIVKGSRILYWFESITRISPEEQIEWMKSKLSASAGAGPEIIWGFFSSTGTFLAAFALIPIYIFFLTYFREKYEKFIVLVNKEHHQEVLEIIKKISSVSRKYLKGVFLDVLILSILGSIGYLVLGIKHAILFGVLAAILNIIPYIGVMFGSLLPILMALITKDDIGYAFGALGVALVVQFIDNNFISPYIVGSSVSLNPLTAIIVLIIGALIWGIPGMVLSIPLAGMMKVAFDNIEGLKPYGYLIGEEINYLPKRFFHKGKKTQDQ